MSFLLYYYIPIYIILDYSILFRIQGPGDYRRRPPEVQALAAEYKYIGGVVVECRARASSHHCVLFGVCGRNKSE